MEIPEITRLTNSNQHSNTASISIQHDRAIATSFVKYLLPISIFFLALMPSLKSQHNVIYYVPFTDQQLHECFKVITDAASRSISNDIIGTISVVSSDDGTEIIYDHWEDGYEVDIENPVQGTTQIWGDGNTGNGDASSVCSSCTGDTVDAGDVLTLENTVPIPRNPSQIYYDGSDKIASTRSLAVTRAGYSTDPGTVLADATEVIDTSSYDLEYISPVGEDMSGSLDNDMFEFTAMFIMAAQNNTQVQIDKDGNGSFETTVTISEGENYKVTNVEVGGRVLADKPVQVQVFTSDLGARYENRWFTLYPYVLWDDSYYSPIVGTGPSEKWKITLIC